MQAHATVAESPTRTQTQWWTIAYRGLLALSLIIMTAHVLIYVAFGIALIPFPFDYDQAEGFELNNAILFAQGNCPYCNNDVFPFFASGYAPFYHLLLVPFVWIFGPAYWYGRLLIFIATFLIAGAIARAIWREKPSWWVALLGGMAFLASNYIYHIGPLLRQHLLMVLFETLAVVIIANAFVVTQRERRWRLLAAFTLLLLAGYTKQLAYSTCIAIALWVFLRNPRTMLIYSVGLIAVAVTIFAGAMLVTDGQWWINIISSNQNEYITEQFVGLLRQFITLHWPLLLMAGITVLYELYCTRLSIYSIWFVVSFASTIGAGKWGAGDSYFATTLAAACILSGIFVMRSLSGNWRLPFQWFQHKTRQQSLAVLGLSLFILYGLTVIKLPTSGPIFGPLAETIGVEPKPGHRYPLYDAADWTVGYAVTGHFPSAEDVQNGWQIVEAVRQADGYVMSEDAGFSILAEREVITNAVQLRNLWENNLYDPSELLQMVENHEFGLIIRRGDFFPVPVLIAMDTYYELDSTIPMNGFAYQLWRPKTEAPAG